MVSTSRHKMAHKAQNGTSSLIFRALDYNVRRFQYYSENIFCPDQVWHRSNTLFLLVVLEL